MIDSLDELIASMKKVVQANIERFGSVKSEFMCVMRDGSCKIINLLFPSSIELQDQRIEHLKEEFKRLDIVRYVFAGEAWFSPDSVGTCA